MKLISEELYNSLIKDSKTRKIQNIDYTESPGQSILNSDVPDDIKLALYMQIIKDFNKNMSKIISDKVNFVNVGTSPVKSKLDFNTEELESEDPLTDTIINDFFPERHRNSARYIIKILRTRPDLITWNEKFEVTFLKDDFCAGSSILDLISYLLRDLKWDLAPKGSNRFLLICKLLNVPTSLVRKALRTKMSADFDDMTSVKSASDSTTHFPELKDKIQNWISLEEEYFTDDGDK